MPETVLRRNWSNSRLLVKIAVSNHNKCSKTKGDIYMETKDILRQLRKKNNLTQEQMAEQVLVTRQAVSRWENGETQPNTDTLKIISKKFGISINSLLGSPRQLVCQCCGRLHNGHAVFYPFKLFDLITFKKSTSKTFCFISFYS